MARKISFELRIFLRKMLRNFPNIFEPLFCGSENPAKCPSNFPLDFPAEKRTRKFHPPASAGAQGERVLLKSRRFQALPLYSLEHPNERAAFEKLVWEGGQKSVAAVDNPSTSYRIGKPTKCKNTLQHTKHETPRNTPSNTPWNTKKYEIRIFGVFFWYFRGIFSIPCRREN